MDREPIIGEIVVVTRNSDSHDLTIGEKLAVCRIDESDETIQGWTRTSKTASNWIPWADVEPVEFGWDYVKRHLPPYLADILAACEGIEFLALNDEIKRQIQGSVPDWQQRVEEAVGQTESPTSGSLDAFAADEDIAEDEGQADEDEDDDDDDDDDDDEDDDEDDDDHPLFDRGVEDQNAPF